jgi:outer membrane biosynthesis protein TonB
VKTAEIANSQVPDLDKVTLAAVKKWSFKPGNRSIRIVLKFSLQ